MFPLQCGCMLRMLFFLQSPLGGEFGSRLYRAMPLCFLTADEQASSSSALTSQDTSSTLRGNFFGLVAELHPIQSGRRSCHEKSFFPDSPSRCGCDCHVVIGAGRQPVQGGSASSHTEGAGWQTKLYWSLGGPCVYTQSRPW